LIIRQYIKGKKAKYGIKLYILAESNGLALKMIVYGGAADKELGGKNHTNKVVFKLMNGKTGYGHSLFMDNFYNSVELTESMLNEDTFVTGTLRSNRKGNSVDVANKKLKTGESISQYTEHGVCITKWKDRREVLSISSEFDGKLTETTNRFGKRVTKPKMIVEYNKFMGGIDYHDQMMAYYPCQRKTLRWYKKLGIHIFQSMLLNSYYLYRETSDKKATLYDFRLAFIKKLLHSTTPLSSTLPCKIHLPILLEKGNNGKTKRCKYCLDTLNKRCDSIYCCPDCSGNPGFCLDPCFRLFHKYK
jgi:hypothetical protein